MLADEVVPAIAALPYQTHLVTQDGQVADEADRRHGPESRKISAVSKVALGLERRMNLNSDVRKLDQRECNCRNGRRRCTRVLKVKLGERLQAMPTERPTTVSLTSVLSHASFALVQKVIRLSEKCEEF